MIQIPFDKILVGFVYSSNEDPNNHKIWLDLRMFDRPLCSIYCDKLDIDAECGSMAWAGHMPNGQLINHGRIVINGPAHIEAKSVNPLHLSIIGPGHQRLENPRKDIADASLKYDVKNNLWVCEIMDNDKALERHSAQDLLCTVKMESHTSEHLNPKFSMKLEKNHISHCKVLGNVLVIS